MTAATTRARAQGVLILALAVAIGWGAVTLVVARSGVGIAWVLGRLHARLDAPRYETLFDLFLYGTLIVVAVVAAGLERRNALALGARPLRWTVIGVLVGVGGLGASALDAWLAGVMTPDRAHLVRPGLLLWGVATVGFAAVAEEVYFRGWLQAALVGRWGAVAGVLASAVAFALVHVAGEGRDVVSLANLFLGGIAFGLFALRGGGLAGAIGAHAAWNVAEELGLGLDPNPGAGAFGAWWDHDLVGPAIWGGSGEGLNASIGMTVTLLAIVVPLLALRRSPALAAPVKLRPAPSGQRAPVTATAAARAGARVR